MKTATHGFVAQTIAILNQLPPDTARGLGEGAVAPDPGNAVRHYPFRSRHHGGAEYQGYIADWISRARRRWLQGHLYMAGYDCGVALHYLMDCAIPGAASPLHSQLEARCANAVPRIEGIAAVAGTPETCLQVASQLVATMPWERTSGTEIMQLVCSYAHYVAASVFAQPYAPLDPDVLLMPFRRSLREIHDELAADRLRLAHRDAVSAEHLARYAHGVEVAKTRREASLAARRIRRPLQVASCLLIVAAVALGVSFLPPLVVPSLWLPAAACVSLLTVGLVWLVTAQQFGPFSVVLFAWITCTRLYLPHTTPSGRWLVTRRRHRRKAARAWARRLVQYGQRRRQALTGSGRAWGLAYWQYARWYLLPKMPVSAEAEGVSQALRAEYGTIPWFDRLTALILSCTPNADRSMTPPVS